MTSFRFDRAVSPRAEMRGFVSAVRVAAIVLCSAAGMSLMISPSMSSTILSSEPFVTSTTPTVAPSRRTVARSQTAAISIIRWEMKIDRAVAASLTPDHLEDPLGEIRGQGRGHLVEHQDVRLGRHGTGEVDDAERGQRQVPSVAGEVEVAEGRARRASGGTVRVVSRSAAGSAGCRGPGSATAPGTRR